MTISKEPLRIKIHAALFDVDGTIVDSTDAIGAFWRDFAKTREDFDAEEVIDISHGWRTFDVISKYAPDLADEAYVTALEGSVPDKYGEKAKEIAGSPALVKEILELEQLEGKQRVAVATSGTYEMASKWFKILDLKRPKAFITAESVKFGKPHPEPYLLGRKMLGFDETAKVVVFEDAKAGIESGNKAGCFTIGIASTYDAKTVQSFGADLVVPDLTGVKVSRLLQDKDQFELVIEDYHFVSQRLLKSLKH